MRVAVLPFLLIIALAYGGCTKNRRIVRRIEGTWKVEQFLHNDGTYSYPDETHVFSEGEPGGKTYAPWTKYTPADTVSGSYNIGRKGEQIIFRNDNVTPVQADTFAIDDMDKETLIIRNWSGIIFFRKQ